MFGTRLLDRRSRPERIADQAWEHLVAAVNSAGDSARSNASDAARSARRKGYQLTDGASDRIGSVTDEAWRRANRAVDALAGRRPGLPWGVLIGAGLVGAAIGWATSTAARTAIAARSDRWSGTDRVEFVDVDQPDSPVTGKL